MDHFSTLFAIEKSKSICLSIRLQAWEWKRPPAAHQELLELQQCSSLIAEFSVSDRADSWTWVDSPNCVFLVSFCRKLLSQHATPFYPFHWVKGVPRKISIFGWRAEQDRLPALKGLKRKKMLPGPTTYELCGEGEEDANHLLTSCYVAAVLWLKISLWCSVPPIFAFSVKDLLNVHKYVNASEYKRKLIRKIILGGCWILWKARNEAIFKRKRVNFQALIGEVQAITFSWVKYKAKDAAWTWENWVAFDMPIT